MDSPATLFDNDNGFKIHIGAPSEFPLLTQHHLPISPGQQHTVILGAVHLSTTDRVKQLSMEARNCLFPQEQPADSVYSEYSYTTCLFECGLKLVSAQLGCTPWYLPSLPNSTMCNPWDAATFIHRLEAVAPASCRHCLPDCDATTYTVTALTTPIRKCDSRNINLDPFCSLSREAKSNPWIEDVTSLYKALNGEQLPDYIEDMTKSTRPQYRYPEDEKMDVLLQGKVRLFLFLLLLSFTLVLLFSQNQIRLIKAGYHIIQGL